MRNSAIFLCLCLLALAPSASNPQTPALHEPDAARIPTFIFEGLHQLGDQKPEDAERAWFRGGPLEGQPVSSQLRSILDTCGRYQNFDVVSVQDLTPRMRVFYLALNFEKQPRIVKFVVYRTLEGWILLSRKIDVNEEIFETVSQPARD
ncbi:MAG: hypothetical protein ABSF23_15635 [Terracidiphilus sp.]